MHMYDLLIKKRDGEALSAEEICYMIHAYVAGEIEEYQMSAMLMAIYFQGMTDEETAALTKAMAESGTMVDLSAIDGIKVDKHSTGGVGDKTTFIVGPLVAACGGKVAKMSGRGLGHTGGTIDKMESIPHVRIALTQDEFFRIVNTIGVSIVGQSDTLAPADKKLYALRDVIGTVDSMPLIASSVMSKKLASGSDAILLDVKVGSGAFMKTVDDGLALARLMVHIGEANGRRTVALLTDMDCPLGQAVGNANEMREVIATLRGKGPADLTEEALLIAANMLYLCGKGSYEECQVKVKNALSDGSGLEKLAAMLEAQGGDVFAVETKEAVTTAHEAYVYASSNGYVTHMDAEAIGLSAVHLGAGRLNKGDTINYRAGIYVLKKIGDAVQAGEALAKLTSDSKEGLADACKRYAAAVTIGDTPVQRAPLILARVTKDGVERFDRGQDIREGQAADGSSKEIDSDELLRQARMSREQAYVPYSHFPVGAAVLTESGAIYGGCNIENASFGLTNCAERTAIYKSVADGHTRFKALAVIADTPDVCAPCGACRQVISEFAIPYIILANMEGRVATYTAEELLPLSFTAKDIKQNKQ